MDFPFSSFYSQHSQGIRTCKVLSSSVAHRNPGWPKAGGILQNFTAFVGFASAFMEILTPLSIHPTKNCTGKREIIPDTKTHRSWELIPPPLSVVLNGKKVNSRASPAPAKAGKSFKFIFLPLTLFKQGMISKDQRLLKMKYLG